MPLSDVIAFASRILDESKLPYAIVGGLAVGARGEPRLTRDIDVVIKAAHSDVSHLLNLIETSGLKIEGRAIIEEKLQNGKPAKIVWNRKMSFDLRAAKFLIDNEAIDSAEKIGVFGNELFVVRAEELIVYKLARFSAIDQVDVAGIIIRQAGKLDWNKIVRLSEGFSRETKIDIILPNLASVMQDFGAKKS